MEMSVRKVGTHWQLDEINFRSIRQDMVRDNEKLFYLLAAASFVEITADLYTGNLIEHFRNDNSAGQWLAQVWQQEEMQHGRALKTYIQTVWPDFDWERAYAGFAAEYGALCTMEALESSRALEMVARCVVEVGTSTFYRCLHTYAEEPVLRSLLANIKADEVRHFKKFRQLFLEYNVVEGNSSLKIWQAIWKRAIEGRNEDSYIAFKHAYLVRNQVNEFDDREWKQFSRWFKNMARRFYPYRMAAKMLLSPLPVAYPLKNMMQPFLVGGFWVAMF